MTSNIPLTAQNFAQADFIAQPAEQLWQHISPLYCVDESAWLNQLLPLAEPEPAERAETERLAEQLIKQVRADKKALQMIDGDVDFLLEKDSQSARSIYFDLKRKFIRPKVIVDYDREVYMLDYNDIRVTFDKNIRVNTSDLDLFNPDLETQTLQRPDTIIMEVKFNTCLPSWFSTLLKLDGTTAMAISKYCQGRMHMREYYGD